MNKGPYAVVTGASQGIGKVIAEHLLQAGFSVAACARNASALAHLKQQWTELNPGRHIVTHAADLSTREGVVAFSEQVSQAFKTVDVLVNNAGTFVPGNIFGEPEGRLEHLLDTNLLSAYRLTRLMLPAMMRQQSGHIFNICSVASLRAYPNGGSYSISKYALLGFSENLREELRPYHIKVTSVCPGATLTPSWAGSGVPEDRIMEAADIAKMLVAAYLLSPQANVDTITMRPVKGDL